MVGEIRDLETAEIAIKAAQTGHMVLSTLHTNSAPETLIRLRYMGIPAFKLATSVSLIIAQRLAHRLCRHCKRKDRNPRKKYKKSKDLKRRSWMICCYSRPWAAIIAILAIEAGLVFMK
jgi:type IV pilus assembly protein PilB